MSNPLDPRATHAVLEAIGHADASDTEPLDELDDMTGEFGLGEVDDADPLAGT